LFHHAVDEEASIHPTSSHRLMSRTDVSTHQT